MYLTVMGKSGAGGLHSAGLVSSGQWPDVNLAISSVRYYLTDYLNFLKC